MKIFKKGVWFVTNGCFLFFFNVCSLQAEIKNCPESFQVIKNVQVHSTYLKSSNTCMVSVSPMMVSNLRYRSYLFSDDGMFLVFNSFGPGNPATETGAREFYFFPRKQLPEYWIDTFSENLVVRMASGHEAVFDPEHSRLIGFRSTQGEILFQESVEIVKANQGGVEFERAPGFWLDLGFALGRQPKSERFREAIVY